MQTIVQYVTDLKTKAKLCCLMNLQDLLIRDQIVRASDKNMIDRLLREPELSLKRAAQIYQAVETINIQLQTLTSQTSADVHTVKEKGFQGPENKKTSKWVNK